MFVCECGCECVCGCGFVCECVFVWAFALGSRYHASRLLLHKGRPGDAKRSGENQKEGRNKRAWDGSNR